MSEQSSAPTPDAPSTASESTALATATQATPPTTSATPPQAPAGRVTLALLAVLLMAVAALVFISLRYFQLEQRFAHTAAELAAAEEELEATIARLAEQEARTMQEPGEHAPQPSASAPAAEELTREMLYEAWERVREAGMPRHRFLLELQEPTLWALYRHLQQELSRAGNGHEMTVRDRRWLALINARLGMLERARNTLAATVNEDETAWETWIELAHLCAAHDAPEAAEAALEQAADAAPDEPSAQQRIAEQRTRIEERLAERNDPAANDNDGS